jgi:hypothetical protein
MIPQSQLMTTKTGFCSACKAFPSCLEEALSLAGVLSPLNHLPTFIAMSLQIVTRIVMNDSARARIVPSRWTVSL